LYKVIQTEARCIKAQVLLKFRNEIQRVRSVQLRQLGEAPARLRIPELVDTESSEPSGPVRLQYDPSGARSVHNVHTYKRASLHLGMMSASL
jgi:hypothetical protein